MLSKLNYGGKKLKKIKPMKYRFLIIILFLIVKSSIGQEFTDLKGDYLGLKPPGILPEVFAPGIVSDTSWREHCQVAFSSKGDEIYWSAWSSKYPPADTSMRNIFFYAPHARTGYLLGFDRNY